MNFNRPSGNLVQIVRRLSAVLLVLLFVGAPVLSALAVTSVSSDLPTCCRKNGAHRCSIRRTQSNQKDEKPRLNAVCPFGAKSTLAVLGQRVGIFGGTNSSSGPVPRRRAAGQSQVLVPVLERHFENPKRGPPLP